MKISYRILIINFAIVAVILISAALGFYSIVYNILTQQQQKYLINSANVFLYAYRENLQFTEEELAFKVRNNTLTFSENNRLDEKNIDFIFRTDDFGKLQNYAVKNFVSVPEILSADKIFRTKNFLEKNPYAIIQTYKADGGIYYYGRILTINDINSFAGKMNADVAVVLNNTITDVSNESENKKYLYALNDVYRYLSEKNNFELSRKEIYNSDILSTVYRPSGDSEISNLNFLIFSSLSEAADLNTALKYIFIILGFAGLTLSLILTLLFTDRLRKQITLLSKATEITREGNFNTRIEVKSKDEIGKLAAAFNTMLSQLEINEKAKNEYSEFITLINQNPTLDEISDAALRKIIKTCGFTTGALYIKDEDKIILASSYGIKKEPGTIVSNDFFNEVIKTHEKLEINFTENAPVISTGSISINLKYLLVLPVIYNNSIIGILELGAPDKPSAEAAGYLSSIQEQLAIGLTNATALVQLEKLVKELKILNEDYQKQNLQVRKQNETLVDLHLELKEKAEELEVQKKKAEESTRLKSQFLASMSHELRTPMNSILGLTELILEESSFKGKNRERLEVVLKSGRRLMDLINDILDLSKIEAGKMEIRAEDVYLEELVKDVETSISPLLINKSLQLRISRLTSTNIIINTDRGKVTQVLINLLGNAVKFTETGYVELKVSSSNDRLDFDIVDSGIGISEEDQKVIFEEFRQVDGTSTRKYSGTGLGLAICKRIADLLKGGLSVKSSAGKGSVFTFSIPLKFVEVKEEALPQGVNVEALIKNRKNPILVIDDDPEIRYTIGQYLTSRGYEVIFAESGEKGIQEAVKAQPFAITLDVMLPNKDGWDILKELKENPATRDIPVILISILNDKNMGYGLGAYEYFVKPISRDKLYTAFNKLESLAKKRIEKIVIVDDDELEYEKFRREFSDAAIKIEYISDSELAFNRILEIQPDLIILDLIMPKVDGLSLSYKLKSNRETRHIPIIISTARDLSEEEKSELQNIVEEITVKSKGHPLDVLKVVRDRIRMHELINSDTPALPFRKVEEEEIVIEEFDNNEKKNEEENVQGEVLIVDDDPDTLFTINEIVKACNCKTVLASNGIECLKALENNTPDVILLDIMMPEMDGFQTISKIRENRTLKHIPVFAVTAKAMLEDREIILKHGFDDYIPKPVNAGSLAFKIEKVLSKINIT
jgi:signal transduction histidine kinase/CheY-like chemotaxis protein/HAMP domain-containing protein